MTELSKFVSIRLIDGKQKKVIVDICGYITNRNPTKEELKSIKKQLSVHEILKLPEDEAKNHLLEFLIYFYNKNRRSPTMKDFNNSKGKYPSFNIYSNLFGSWNNSLIMAGLPINWGGSKVPLYTKEELLRYLPKFYDEYGRPPKREDFVKNSKYPGHTIYTRLFGSWTNALKLVGLDANSMIRKGVVETPSQKARLAEILVIEHFSEKDKVVDLSGQNCNNPYDGICPKNQLYDVKSSRFNGHYWEFVTKNLYKEDIEWYYLLAFNKDYSELIHAWRIQAIDFISDIEKGQIVISIKDNSRKYNIKNMIQHEITDIILPIFKNWLKQIENHKNNTIETTK